VQPRRHSHTLSGVMTNRNFILLVAAILSLGWGTQASADRPDGPGFDGRGERGNDRGSERSGRPDFRNGEFGRDRPSREFAPDHFVRPADGDWPSGRRFPREELRTPGREYELDERVVALSDAVSMVQSRFNATAVKTDTVTEGGQLVYRIRLLSADRSRVWTVTVDARTGRIN